MHVCLQTGCTCVHMHTEVSCKCTPLTIRVHKSPFVFKSSQVTDSGREIERENERSSMLLLLCRVFITLRGPALIMHGYMAPQTSQCFTGGGKKQHCEMRQECNRESTLPHTVCQAFYLLVNSANNSSILFIYNVFSWWITHLSINLFIYSFISSFTHSLTQLFISLKSISVRLCILMTVAHLQC